MGFNVDINYKVDTALAQANLRKLNAQLQEVENKINRMHTTGAKGANLHANQMKSLALRFVGYNLILNQVMNAQQKLIDYIRESVTAYREFQTRIAEVNTILKDEATGTIERLSLSVESLSMRYGKATSDMSKGLYDILSAAFSTQDAINLLNTATKASIAGLSDVRTSVDIFTTVLNSYGMAVEQATNVSDILFQSVVRGKFQFEDLESALGYVVPIASQAGIAFDGLMAALSTATRHGLHLDMTARGLALAIQNIIDPSAGATKAAQKYNIELSGLALRIKGLSGFFEELKNRTDEFGKSILTELIPNMRSLRVAMVLASEEGLQGMEDDLTQLNDAIGRTNEAFGKIEETSGFIASQIEQKYADIARNVGDAWDEVFINVKRGALDVGGAIVGGLKLMELAGETLLTMGANIFSGKAGEDWNKIFGKHELTDYYINMQKQILAEGHAVDTLNEKLKIYLKTLADQQRLSKEFGETTDTDRMEDITEAFNQTQTVVELLEETWNNFVGDIKQGFQDLDDLDILLGDIERDIERLQEELQKPVQAGYGSYYQIFEGTLRYQEAVIENAKYYADVQHDIKRGLEDENYQFYVLNEEQQKAVIAMREFQKAQEQAKKTTELLNIAMRELQLRAAKIQLAGLMRRRGLTRQEEKELKKIQIEQLKLRIANMEAEGEQTVEMTENYQEQKDILDAFVNDIEEERYQLKYNYDQQLKDIRDLIANEEYILSDRIDAWETTRDKIVDTASSVLESLKDAFGDDELADLLAARGIDLATIADELERIKTGALTLTPPSVSASLGGGIATSTGRSFPATITSAPEVRAVEIVAPTVAAGLKNLVSELGGSLPGFKRGVDFVPRDMIAMLHQGESIVPAGREITPSGDNIQININLHNPQFNNREDVTRYAKETGRAMSSGVIDAKTNRSRYKLLGG